MKILHILDHSLPLHSGYTFRSRNIFQCQQDVGLEPVVVTSPKHEVSWQGEWAPEEEIDGVRYHRSGAVQASKLPFFAERKLMAALERRIEHVARREKPQILHAHSPVLNALPAIRVGARLGIPVVYEIRAFWEDAAVDHGSYREGGLKYRMVRALETRACRQADRVVTICAGLRSDLIQRGIPEAKLSVVPNAVNIQEFTPVARDLDLARTWGLDGSLVIGFLGSFYHYEGLDLLLEAVARIVKGTTGITGNQGVAGTDSRFPISDSQLSTNESRPGVPASQPSSLPAIPPLSGDIKLLLVGGGPQEEVLKQLASDLGIADRVVFTGRLPHDQMPTMYSLIDVLCFPRKRMRLTDLVTPLKPLETMAMGKTMVASDVGGHRELIQDGETGLLFRADDIGSLTSSLQRVLTDADLRRGLEEQGRAWVSQHRTWAANGGRYRALCERLLQG